MNPSTALATVIVGALADLGVRQVVLSPGSRSAPLAYALAAAAGEGASQTTDQVRVFGPAVRWFADLPAPYRQAGQVLAWRNVVARAVAAARGNPGGDPGPVQLNVAFGEPLTPDPDDLGEPGWPESLTGTDGLTTISAAAPALPVRLPPRPRTVVLAGDDAGPEAAAVAAAMGWPLLAEPSSGARTGGAIGPYRLLLEHPDLGAAIERVVVFGRTTLSRPVSRLLSRPDLEVVVVSRRPDWTDAGRRATLVVPGVSVDAPAGGSSWADSWRVAGVAAGAAIDRVLDEEAAQGRLSGPLIAREVAAVTGPGDTLFAGSSNPIRDLDLTAGPFDPAARVLANRGLAGIDGTLSSASGVALSGIAGAALGGRPGTAGGRVRCLVGDLTFLHDAGGLLVGPLEQRVPLQIVVVDDDGGGIFSVLEHAAYAARGEAENALFERVFATPQRVDLAQLCAGYGVDHQVVDDVAGLRKALAEPLPGTSVIQIRVDRAAHRDLADRLRNAALAAVRLRQP
jgi:2-succinyl-5-enolpyruvyl-6-hydroxy-3-cyclohexene-1-carboxylate synthase